MTDHTDLIKRLEAADGPDALTDSMIYVATTAGVSMLDVECGRVSPRPYTSSVDAAFTLVFMQEEWAITLMTVGCPHNGNTCILGSADGLAVHGEAKTSALAICIAALKAQEQGKR